MSAAMNSGAQPVDVLYILGPGHCGSTLLNLCLDRHSRVMGVSEIVTLNGKRPGYSGDEDALAIPFWTEVDRVMRASRNGALTEVAFNLGRVPSFDKPKAVALNHAAAQAVLSVSGKQILADASKDPHRLMELLKSPLFRVRVIYLVRDGRAVVHAYRRKYGTWFRGWRKLKRIERVARRMRAQHGSDAWLTIRYEDMVTDLKGTLRYICDFADIDFEADMLEPDTASFNGLGGNRLRKRPVERITLDSAWKMEMSRPVRAFTALAVAGFNARHGYRG